MVRLYTALLATILLQQEKPKPPPAEDAPPVMKWEIKPEDKFDLKWTFSETRHLDRGGNDPVDTGEKRDVDAEIVYREAGGVGGSFGLNLKKVVWVSTQREFEVTLTMLEGKAPVTDVKARVKDEPKSTFSKVALAKQTGEAMAQEMKKLVVGDYAINTTTREREAFMTRNGVANETSGTSLFARAFLHPKLANGAVDANHKWGEPFTTAFQSSGLVDINFLEYKVTAVTKTGITAKGGFNVPIAPPVVNTDQKTTGSYVYSREFTFSRDYYLASSREESLYSKKVDAKVKFYQEDTSVKLTQQFTIKKRPPPKEAPKEAPKEPPKK